MTPRTHTQRLAIATLGLNILHVVWLLLIAVAIGFAPGVTWDVHQ